MVRDHHINSQALGVGDFLVGGDPIVHGNDQLHAFPCQGVHRREVHAVSLSVPLGDVEGDVGIFAPQIGVEDGGGSDPVRVVVPIYGDFLKIFQGAANARHRPVHILHLIGVREPFPAQQAGDPFLIRKTPNHKKRRQQRRDTAVLRQIYRSLFIQGR